MFNTSVAVALREGHANIIDRLETIDEPAFLSVLSVVELEGGVPLALEGVGLRRKKLDELYHDLTILDFTPVEAFAYRQIIALVGFSRSNIIDRMIAAQAIVAGATLATLNPRDFRNIPDLLVEDWSVGA